MWNHLMHIAINAVKLYTRYSSAGAAINEAVSIRYLKRGFTL